jgi:hypothetical protein
MTTYKLTVAVDPDSPKADELRQLLNVVSGRAPDGQGRVSEPLVKEELAIVEFLTAKSSTSKSSASTERTQPPGEDQTPVDLLLGLAKTSSGRRAAEEEKRQFRLQRDREMEEQRNAQRRFSGQPASNSNSMASPWGYVAPSMPGLDVQQPFGIHSIRRGPRPLQPPPSKRGSSSQPMDLNDVDLSFGLDFQRPQSVSSSSSHPEMGGAGGDGLNGLHAMGGEVQVQHQQGSGGGLGMQNVQMAPPLSSMAGLPLSGLPLLGGGSDNDFFSGQQTQDTMNEMNMMLAPQFGSANMNGFDFSDLGLGTGEAGEGFEGQFNPFALAQANDG